jgi:hypothetical protein
MAATRTDHEPVNDGMLGSEQNGHVDQTAKPHAIRDDNGLSRYLADVQMRSNPHGPW